jgi:hypothetical protein
MNKNRAMKGTLQAFNKSIYKSTKHSNYFAIYDLLLHKYVSKNITVVEVGVATGGSLFMWRSYFGEKARIIGIDNNPAALRFNDDFEIFIGDQSDPQFWEEFFSTVGNIDILIDDGGHKNSEQIVTVISSISNIRNGGILIVEDVHTSFWDTFGNPQKYSFFNFAVTKAANLTRRHNSINFIDNSVARVFKIEFYDSIIAFIIDERNAKPGKFITNNGKVITESKEIFISRPVLTLKIRKFIRYYSNKYIFLKKIKLIKILIKRILYLYYRVESKINEKNIKHFFK